MKQSSLRTCVAFLLLILWTAGESVNAQKPSGDTPSLPSNLTLALELQTLPGLNAAGSYWEVSYQWRIADQREFDRWSEGGEDPASQVGTLLSKQSFRHGNLSSSQNRRYEVSVPITGELLKQMRQTARRPQVLWLDATMRIHDATLGADVVRKINPVWGPNSYRDGKANVRVELMPNGNLRWFTPPTPPWVTGQTQNVKSSRKTP
jgi:hypothetical protein